MSEPTHEPSPASSIDDEELLGQLADDLRCAAVEESIRRSTSTSRSIHHWLSGFAWFFPRWG